MTFPRHEAHHGTTAQVTRLWKEVLELRHLAAFQASERLSGKPHFPGGKTHRAEPTRCLSTDGAGSDSSRLTHLAAGGDEVGLAENL